MNRCWAFAAVLGLGAWLVAGATNANEYITVSDLDLGEAPPASPRPPAALGSVAGEPCGCCGDAECGGACCVEGSCRAPRWTVAADAVLMQRIGAPDVRLLRRSEDGLTVLSAKDFAFPFAAGPRLSLTRHGECRDLELVYFMIDGWSATETRSDETGLFFTAPQFFVEANGVPVSFTWSSRLYSAEANLRAPAHECVTLLAGFRWIGLREELVFSSPAVQPNSGPFWSTQTHNHLYGFQIGADARLWDHGGRFRLTGVAKAGVYGNQAEQVSAIPFTGIERSGSALTNRTAFAAECGLSGVYQLADRVAVRAGYQVMWLDGVALPPSQIALSDLFSQVVLVTADSGVFYHGASVGLDVSF
jgi:hypothetical protein